MNQRILGCLALVLFLIPKPGYTATDPLETLRGPVTQAVDILADPRYKAPDAKDEQTRKLRALVDQVFDFTEISRRTLARGWLRFSPDQRREFTDLFSRLLTDVYISRIQGNYSGQKVAFGTQSVEGDRAVVKSQVLREGIQTPVDYSLHMVDGNWRVYDVRVEGVSLVKNYRDQFRQILLNKGPEDLIAQVKKKLKEFNE